MTREYLGDSVYVDFNGFHVVLTANGGEETIYLEPAVYRALLQYVERTQPWSSRRDGS